VEIALAPDEGRFTIACRLPDRSVEDIEREFGLADLRDYLDEADRIRRSRLSG